MSEQITLRELVGKDLGQFVIKEMTEVICVNEDGRKTGSVGFFEKAGVAAVFAKSQTDNYYATVRAFVLTDGKSGFVISSKEPVKFFNDEEEAVKLRQAALAKLTPAERELLRL